jgi:hypothetical protein
MKEVFMASKMLVFSIIMSVLSVGCSGCGKNGPGATLVVGDSISTSEWGYFDPLQALMNPKGYSLTHIPDNAKSTVYTAQNADQWLSSIKPSLIIWNNGIWDCIPQDTAPDMAAFRTTPEQYAAMLQTIAAKFKATGARVVFITTTEIPGGTGCEVQRNQIAAQILPGLGVEIIDLYSFTRGRSDWHGRKAQPLPTDVHFTIPANVEIAKFIDSEITKNQ